MTDPRPAQRLQWIGNAATGFLRLIDQTRLPTEFVQIDCHDVPTVWDAIKALRVRGAAGDRHRGGVRGGDRRTVLWQPRRRIHPSCSGRCDRRFCAPAARLPSTCSGRSTVWTQAVAGVPHEGGPAVLERLLLEARQIDEEDRAMRRAIGRHGAGLVRPGQGILTHCNAGGLATADYGTALAVVFAAHEDGVPLHVFADETRPLLQGARLTAWELTRRGIPVTLICDSMAAQVMRERKVHLVVVGADRIASNGDVANKIGTYGVAVLARAHGIPFYVAAPSSTFDLSIPDGSAIPIEQRDPREITHGFGRQTAPDGVGVYNPAFDVTPAELIAGIITEKGIIRPVNTQTIAATLN